MAIQQGSPALLRFQCREYDEAGKDVGPLNLSDPEFNPLRAVLTSPTGRRIEVNPDVVDAAGGVAEWQAPEGTLDELGPWQSQVLAGDWKARPRSFYVYGPNL